MHTGTRRSAVLFAAALVLPAALAQPVSSQSLPAKGSTETLDVATWNIEWFGSTSSGPTDEDLQLRNAASVIAQSAIDLWAVQEIDDEVHFEALLEALGPAYGGDLGTASSNTMVGFIYRLAVIRPMRVADAWLNENRAAFAGRPPLLMEAEVTLPEARAIISFVSLHMKCCGDGFEKRQEASTQLKSGIDLQLSSEPVIILGDFNDELTGSITTGQPTPYENFVADPDHFRFTSLPLEERGEATWCGSLTCSSGSSLDHVLITDELFGAYLPESTVRYEEVVTAVNDFVRTTSDHLPVLARFALASETAIEEPGPSRPDRSVIYPNPFSRTATVSLSADANGPISVEICDLLGRVVKRVHEAYLAAGTHELSLSADGLAGGLYFVRITSGSNVTATPVLVRR